MTLIKHVQGWAATLTEPDLLDAPLVLRPVRPADVTTREAVYAANELWLRMWIPLDPLQPQRPSTRDRLVSLAKRSGVPSCLKAARARLEAWRGAVYTWTICYDGQYAGELTVWHVMWGVFRTAELGYWVDKRFAGRGIAPAAAAMAADHCFREIGLHRLEAGIQPENMASRRVVEKLGFRNEGTRLQVVHINGGWRDHIYYAITSAELADGMVARLRDARAVTRPSPPAKDGTEAWVR